jgi:hypothetical protein
MVVVSFQVFMTKVRLHWGPIPSQSTTDIARISSSFNCVSMAECELSVGRLVGWLVGLGDLGGE